MQIPKGAEPLGGECAVVSLVGLILYPREGRRAKLLQTAVFLFVAAGLLTLPASAEEPGVVYPEVAGTTVIHGEGSVGITMMLPEAIRISTGNLTIEAGEDARYVWTGFRSHVEPSALCDFCIRNSTRLIPEAHPAPSMGSCYDETGNEVGCQYQAQPLELYFVTDGPATLTLSVPELSGSIELTATAEVEGFLEELPATGCDPLGDCTQGYAYGGKSRTIGLGGAANADVVGFIADTGGINGVINPGVHNLEVCAYPGVFNPEASGDPADHPKGCDEDLSPAPMTGGEVVPPQRRQFRDSRGAVLGFQGVEPPARCREHVSRLGQMD